MLQSEDFLVGHHLATMRGQAGLARLGGARVELGPSPLDVASQHFNPGFQGLCARGMPGSARVELSSRRLEIPGRDVETFRDLVRLLEGTGDAAQVRRRRSRRQASRGWGSHGCGIDRQ